MGQRWGWFGLALATLGCGQTPEPTHLEATDAVDAVDAVWVGCDDYPAGSCLLVERDEPRTVAFWVDAPPSRPATVVVDDREIETSATEVDGGTRVRFTVPAAAKRIRLGGAARGSLEVVWHRQNPVVVEALRAKSGADLVAMCRAIDGAPSDLEPFDRIQLLKLRFGCGTREDLREVVRHETEAAELARTAGLPRAFAAAAATISYTCINQLDDPACAHAWAGRVAEVVPAGPGEAGIRRDFVAAQVAMDSDDLGGALLAYTAAERWSRRLGLTDYAAAAFEQRATTLGELGRVDESIAAARAMYESRGEQPTGCDRAHVINNAAWPLLRLAEAGLVEDPPIDWLLEQVAIFDRGDCVGQAQDHIIAIINLTSALLGVGDVDEAIVWLDALDVIAAEHQVGDLAADLEQLRADVALAANRWDLAPSPLLLSNALTEEPRLRWRGLVQQAQTLERFDMDAAAIDRWRRAEALLDAELGRITMSGGRESFLTARRRSAEGLVEALLRAGRVDEALCHLRLARSRASRAGDRRGRTDTRPEIARLDGILALRAELEDDAAEDWAHAGDELARRRARREQRLAEALGKVRGESRPETYTDVACAQLPERAVGEALLAVQPMESDTVVIVDGARGPRAHRLPTIPAAEADAAAWADAMFAALVDDLAPMTRLRLLPVGEAWRVALHRARLGGSRVDERLVVTHALDLPPIPAGERPAMRALVVADPRTDLPLAREEGDVVARALQAAGWTVELRIGADARRIDLLARLGDVELLHYAGHGIQRGEHGWEAALLLDGTSTIEVVDILGAAAVPRVAVLSGCETGAIHSGLLDGGMSLGRAFLLAGADAALVGDRTVRDEDALALAQALYADLGVGGAFDPAQRLAEATRRAGGDRAAWPGFRVLVR